MTTSRLSTATRSHHCRDTPGPTPLPPAIHHLDRLRSQGYVILEHLAHAEVIEEVRRELEPWFDRTPPCRGDFYGWHTTRIGSVLLKSPASHSLLVHALILSVMDQVLAPNCDWYQVNLSQAVRLHPGQRQQIPHRDDEMWPCAKNGIEYMVNVMWALDDFTQANGATLLWPRSQHRRLQRTADPAHAIAAQMPRGSALVYLGSVTHCGGANRTGRPRTGLIFSYCLGWLKQYENAFLAYPPAIARTFSPRVRELIGYRIHRPNLGNYEGQDPAIALTTDSRTLPTVDALPESIAAQVRDYYARENSSPSHPGVS